MMGGCGRWIPDGWGEFISDGWGNSNAGFDGAVVVDIVVGTVVASEVFRGLYSLWLSWISKSFFS